MPFTAPKPISPAPDDLRGAKVLVVDDERSWRVILETDLRMIGYKVSMAEDDYHHQLMNQSTHPAPEATASVATTPSAKAPRTTLTCHVIEFTPWKFPN